MSNKSLWAEIGAVCKFALDGDRARFRGGGGALLRAEALSAAPDDGGHRGVARSGGVDHIRRAAGDAADAVELADIARFERELLDYVHSSYPEIKDQIMTGKKLSAEQLEKLRSVIAEFKKDFR